MDRFTALCCGPTARTAHGFMPVSDLHELRWCPPRVERRRCADPDIGDQTFARSAEAWRPACVALQVRERTVDVVNPAQFASIDINPRDIRPQEADR